MPHHAHRTIPHAPGLIPVLGHAPALLRDPLGFIGALGRVGGVVRVRLGPRTVCVVTDPALVHTLLVGLAHDCPPQGVRDTLRAAFTAERVASCVPVVEEVTRERVGRWRHGHVIDVAREMNHLALEIVTRALFGARLRADSALAFHRALPDLVRGQLVRSLYPHRALARLPLPVNRGYDAALAVLDRVVDQTLARGGQSNGDGGGDGDGERTLLALLRATPDPATGSPLDEAAVRSEAITMFGAGTEPVATTLTWLFHELLRHPRVCARLMAELDGLPRAAPDGSGDGLTLDALGRLPYTARVLREVTRLHAPHAFLLRTAARDVDLGPYRVPAGTGLLYSLTAPHRDPAHHRDPLRFDPDRWLADRPGGAAAGPHAFLPFGVGEHRCVGETFAWAELAVVAATVLRAWQPLPVAGSHAREVVSGTVQAQGLSMALAARTPGGPAATEAAEATP
ncbi:cytochrome P450 [Streptomyces radicis]|uniref:cytochrome P450 n=1 Tax=Streptomyces radicis TaxID=1750517 RepID=UPI0016014C6F|nr:cytochrome P450 [Streptomyces radicis]